MSTFYDPGPLPGWPIGRPRGSQKDPGEPETNPIEPEGDEATRDRTYTTLGQPTRTGTPEGAEARVRALHDAILSAASTLDAETNERVSLRALHDHLADACAKIQEGDLGSDGMTIGQQFEALLERLDTLIEREGDKVPVTSLGLPADARFLNDMADYINQNFALDTTPYRSG